MSPTRHQNNKVIPPVKEARPEEQEDDKKKIKKGKQIQGQ